MYWENISEHVIIMYLENMTNYRSYLQKPNPHCDRKYLYTIRNKLALKNLLSFRGT